MRIIIKTKNFLLTDAIEEFINEKLGNMDKFLKMLKDEKLEIGKPMDEFFVEIEKETRHHRNGPYFLAKVYVHLPGKTIVAGSESEDIRTAIVDAKNGMQQEIKKYKLKNIELGRRKSRKIKKGLYAA